MRSLSPRRELIETLTYLFEIRGVPQHIRSDNGPEFIAKPLRAWLAEAGVNTLYIEPASAWQNRFNESFNSQLRDGLLNGSNCACPRARQAQVQ